MMDSSRARGGRHAPLATSEGGTPARARTLSRNLSLLAVSVAVLMVSTVIIITWSRDQPDLYRWQDVKSPYRKIQGNLHPSQPSKNTGISGFFKKTKHEKHEFFRSWDNLGVRDDKGKLREGFGLDGLNRRQKILTGDVLVSHEMKLGVPLWKFNATTCDYLDEGQPAYTRTKRNTKVIRDKFRHTYTDVVSNAGEKRLKFALRGMIQNSDLGGPALVFGDSGVSKCRGEVELLLGDSFRSLWDDESLESFIQWILGPEQRCDVKLPEFVPLNTDLLENGENVSTNDTNARFWRGVQAMGGTNVRLTKSRLNKLQRSYMDLDKGIQGYQKELTIFDDYQGVMYIDDYVLGSWIGLRAYEVGKKNNTTDVSTSSKDGPDVQKTIPWFDRKEVILPTDAISVVEARGMCAIMAANDPYAVTNKAIETTTCPEKWNAPSLFGKLWPVDVLRAYSWSVPMLKAENPKPLRPPFLGSLLRSARLCHATSTRTMHFYNCAYGIGYAVSSDPLNDLSADAFADEPSPEELWRRYNEDMSIIVTGKVASKGKRTQIFSSAYTFVVDCAIFGKGVDLLGGDRVVATEACFNGYFHRLLVDEIGHDTETGSLDDRITEEVLVNLKEAKDRPTQSLIDITNRALGDKDNTVLIVMLRHCFNLADLYHKALWDNRSGYRADATTRSMWQEFVAGIKSAVSSCFFNTGYHGLSESMFIVDSLSAAELEKKQKEQEKKKGVGAKMKSFFLNSMPFGRRHRTGPRSNEEQEDELMVVLLETCEALTKTANDCDGICKDEGDLCHEKCNNVAEAYVSPLCWYGAGAAEDGTPETGFNRCREGCRQLGCSRREWEYCLLGIINKIELGESVVVSKEWPANDYLGKADKHMAAIVDFLGERRHEEFKSWAAPTTGTRLLEGKDALIRYTNLTIPYEIPVTK